MKWMTVVLAVCSLLALGACGSDDDNESSLPQGSEGVNLDPADFTTEIDNPYWPMAPGSRWVYRGTEDGSSVKSEVTVTDETKKIDGITARVIHDVATADGETVEVTDDWFAQDSDGNVWYLGEDTKDFEEAEEEGSPSTEGSWQAGVDGAQAGVVMPAKPEVGEAYRQEYYEGEAEDLARILSVDERVEVPFGSFEDVVMTKDFSPLEPRLLEHKFFARGVGPVLTLAISGENARVELASFRRGRG